MDWRWCVVAILTRSEDRVQLDPPAVDLAPVEAVAILTRSEDRVQHRPAPPPAFAVSLLRSSPGPKTGCSSIHCRDARAGQRCDPHPVRRPGAARLNLALGIRQHVAILTRSEDRVQRRSPHRSRRTGRGCDPHPVRRPGAASSGSGSCRRWSLCCDPHPVRRPGAASRLPAPASSGTSCDPHPVRRPGAAGIVANALRPYSDVAILTRSEDRVQQEPAAGVRAVATVAILTRSEDRVQPVYEWTLTAYVDELRSSPGPKTGCSRCWCSAAGCPCCCDPHPVRRPGAARACSRRSSGCGCCDPHPVRRPGAATYRSVATQLRHPRCDPHPVRRPGAARYRLTP